MNDKLRNWHILTISSYISLIFTIVIWYLIISPPQFILSWIFTLGYLLILFLPAPGLAKKSTGVYMWSSYLILIYFTHAVMESWSLTDITQKSLAILELVLSCIYFLAATMCYRYARQRDKQQAS